jgi:hypothetical protein
LLSNNKIISKRKAFTLIFLERLLGLYPLFIPSFIFCFLLIILIKSNTS